MAKTINQRLHNAKKARNDEFYTQLNDIQLEISHYKKEFKNKIVLCNCDDPYESNFFKYFALNFNALGLKRLIATCYDPSPIACVQLDLFDSSTPELKEKRAFKIEIEEITDINGDGSIDLADVEFLIRNKKNVLTLLNSNGDFQSKECKELLKQADIVVTNPPFSLFKEFISLIREYNKKFLIIGNTNALKYKECFEMFMRNEMRTGYTHFNTGMFFQVPEHYEKFHHLENGKKIARVSTSCWFTNLPVKKHNEDIVLFKSYTPELYPKYDNYDAINVNIYTDIPNDYDGIMGVPITFLDKYNPKQFDIIGCSDRGGDNRPQVNAIRLTEKPEDSPKINGKKIYTRVFIRRRQQQTSEDANIAADSGTQYGVDE